MSHDRPSRTRGSILGRVKDLSVLKNLITDTRLLAASYSVNNGGSFPGQTESGCETNCTPKSIAGVKRSEIILDFKLSPCSECRV
jgi:hypothetical protein